MTKMKRPLPIVNKIIRSAGAALLALAIQASAESTHTVKNGESLDSIGRQYGISAAEIAKANNLDNPDLIQPGTALKIPTGATLPAQTEATPKTYEVKPGDTLGSIAENFSTSVSALAELNGIDDPKNLQVGAVLKIPAPAKPAAAGEKSTNPKHPLPPELKRVLDAMPVTKGKWKKIVIHHSASKKGSLQSMDMYHRQKRKMENGLAYHFVIGNGQGMRDGKIEIGNRWKRQIKGGHLASDTMNQVAIGICLVGNFEVAKPTQAQMQSLYALAGYLSRRCGISKLNVQTHRQINIKPTACPGKYFPTKLLLNNL